MDGPTIQEASEQALAAGTTLDEVLDELRSIDAGIPLTAMTYVNLVFHKGYERFRSEEHTSELQSLMRISYAVFCLKKKKHTVYVLVGIDTRQRQRTGTHTTEH